MPEIYSPSEEQELDIPLYENAPEKEKGEPFPPEPERRFDMITRHSQKPSEDGSDLESPEYPGISESGVELARDKAESIYEYIKNAQEGSVNFMSGTSEIARTRSTMEVYGDSIKEILTENNDENTIVIGESDIAAIAEDNQGEIIEPIAETIKANPDKKFVVCAPIYIKQNRFSRWNDESGGFSPFTKEFLSKGSESDGAREWLKSNGKLTLEDGTVLEGPNPLEVAKEQLEGMKRLKEFASRYVPDRQVNTISVGHSWTIDALTAYLEGNGQIDDESFDRVGGMIKPTEIVAIEKIDDQIKFKYGSRFEKEVEI